MIWSTWTSIASRRKIVEVRLTTKGLTVSQRNKFALYVTEGNWNALSGKTVLLTKDIIKYCKKISIMAIEKETRCLRIVQINLGRSLTAISEFRKHCTKRKVDLTCIWEPAIIYDKLISVPTANLRIFRNKDSITAIIIFNSNLIVTKVNQRTDASSHSRNPIEPRKVLCNQSVLPV